MTDTKPFTDGDIEQYGSALRIEDDGHGGLRVEVSTRDRIATHAMTPTGKNELRRWLSEGRLLSKEDAVGLEGLVADQASTIREIATKLNDHRVVVSMPIKLRQLRELLARLVPKPAGE